MGHSKTRGKTFPPRAGSRIRSPWRPHQISDQIGPEYLATTRVSIILWEEAVEEELVGAARGERQGGDGTHTKETHYFVTSERNT